MTEYLTEYLIIVGGICAAAAAAIAVGEFRHRRYLRRWAKNMARELSRDETGGLEE